MSNSVSTIVERTTLNTEDRKYTLTPTEVTPCFIFPEDEPQAALALTTEIHTLVTETKTGEVLATETTHYLLATPPGLIPGPPGKPAVWQRHSVVTDAQFLVDGLIPLPSTPVTDSEFVFINGLEQDCGYFITGNTLVFEPLLLAEMVLDETITIHYTQT